MHFRSQRKLQGEVSLADTLETAGEGGSLSLMDVIAVDDTMLEDLDTRDACRRVRRCGPGAEARRRPDGPGPWRGWPGHTTGR